MAHILRAEPDDAADAGEVAAVAVVDGRNLGIEQDPVDDADAIGVCRSERAPCGLQTRSSTWAATDAPIPYWMSRLRLRALAVLFDG